ncbi:MAG: hypothetical protein ACTSR8_22415 [Promethearchaeota archaeon]
MQAKEYVDWYNEKFIQSLSNGNNLCFPKEDQLVLIELIEKYDIKSVLEFGTFEGCTTNLIHLHPNIKRIKTLDWGKPYPIERYGSYFKKAKNVELVFTQTSDWKPTCFKIKT